KENWIVLHKRDEHAVEGWDPEDHPQSVITGRTNDDVKADPGRGWTREGEETAPSAPSVPAVAADALQALDELPAKGKGAVQGRELALTNLDKVLFPGRDGDPPVTKRELIRYYVTIGPVMLPYLANRPLNLHRFPDGVDKPGFWQKEAPKYAPEWIPRWRR